MFTILLPVLILAAATLGLLLLGAFTNNARLILGLTGATLLAAAAPLVQMPITGAVFSVEGGHLLHISPFTLMATLILLPTAALCLPLFTHGAAMPINRKPEASILILLSVTGMCILMAAADFITLYAALELMSFPLYILAAFNRDDAKSSEAGLKYFVLGGLASGLTLYGISLIYAATGTTTFLQLGNLIQSATAQPILLVGVVLTLVGILFKLSVAPFHMWTPDVYEGAPTPVTAVMAALPKIAAFALLIRLFVGPFVGLADIWQPALAILAAFTMVVGSTVAILQTNLKRLLAYSTIANVGFILTGVVANTPVGGGGVLFYLAIYAVTTLGLFAAIMALGATTIADLKGLASREPTLAAILLILLFSLAGIPPLAGFMAKFGVFLAAVQAGYVTLAVIGVVASVIASFYSLWLIKLIYFDAPEKKYPIPTTTPGLQFVLTVAVTLTLVLGLFPNLLSTLTLAAATAVF